ncbi:hydrolase [Streptomyces armeniacus]|uniref:Hydrolase n=1 Tax=Streptomyces armeniacus TaxID=83291 RepID=A0A345XXM5_9ACTN|nr:phytase [Streptomyces armeniacus]AXK36391.1 hydrolase [Streptomyces armeniacus]
MTRKRRSGAVALAAFLAVLAGTATVPAAGADDSSADSADSATAGAADRAALPGIAPRAETAAMFDDDEGGDANADDPAIWRNDADPDASLVIATAKTGGLRVYDLDAEEVQSIPAPEAPGPDDAPGRFNNVDLVHGMKLGPGPADLAVTSDRGSDKLRVHRIDGDRPDAPLTDVTDPSAPWIFSGSQDEVNEESTAYGLATFTDAATGRSYALVSQNATTAIALLELTATANGTVTYRHVRTVELPGTFTMPDGTAWSPCGDPGEGPQVEGMVVDPETDTLFAGQEDVGVWRMPADLTGGPVIQDKVREYGVPAEYDEPSDECVPGEDPGFGGTHVSADVEGLTLLRQDEGDGYLLTSSQGDSSFAAFDREASDDYEYEGGFRVTAASGTLDGSEECDGADVLNEPLGARYPDGLLVVQDGHTEPEDGDREATGFKFVDLADVLDALDD